MDWSSAKRKDNLVDDHMLTHTICNRDSKVQHSKIKI